jgi:hypothetical protein
MTYTAPDAHTLSVTVQCNTDPNAPATDTAPTFDYFYTVTGSTVKLWQSGSSDVLTLSLIAAT